MSRWTGEAPPATHVGSLFRNQSAAGEKKASAKTDPARSVEQWDSEALTLFEIAGPEEKHIQTNI